MSVRRMLIVDDEQDICACLQDFFTLHGFFVVSAFSGEEALARMEEEPVDVVLLDILLPGLCGIEVLRRMKERCPSACVIMVTALDQPDLRFEAQRWGAAAYVTKPFDFSDATWSVALLP